MDEQQQKRFKRAVERKAEQAEAASQATAEHSPAEAAAVGGDQHDLIADNQPQDTRSVRDKNTRHRKVTADKWNQ